MGPVRMWEQQARQLIGLQERYKEVLNAMSYYRDQIENKSHTLVPYLSKTYDNEMHSSGHRLSLEKKEKFNLSKFKREHPDMYANYCDEDYKIKIEVEK
jgi:hypothetical protein